jgi:hypothetical protein
VVVVRNLGLLAQGGEMAVVRVNLGLLAQGGEMAKEREVARRWSGGSYGGRW